MSPTFTLRVFNIIAIHLSDSEDLETKFKKLHLKELLNGNL